MVFFQREPLFFFVKNLKNITKIVDKIAKICCASLDYKHFSRRRPMAQNFLSDLKLTLDNCIADLDEIHFMFCQNPEADLQEIVNSLSMIIFSSCFKCRVSLFQMKSWISSNILFQLLQNLLLHSSDSNFNQKDGISCSIYLWNSAGNCLISSIAAIAF